MISQFKWTGHRSGYSQYCHGLLVALTGNIGNEELPKHLLASMRSSSKALRTATRACLRSGGMLKDPPGKRGFHHVLHVWLVVSTPLKIINQLELLFPIYGKITMFQTTNHMYISGSCLAPSEGPVL